MVSLLYHFMLRKLKLTLDFRPLRKNKIILMGNNYKYQKQILVLPAIWLISLLLSLGPTLLSIGIVTLHPQFLFVHFFNNNSYLFPESQKCLP